jgi:hypothetical protein
MFLEDKYINDLNFSAGFSGRRKQTEREIEYES